MAFVLVVKPEAQKRLDSLNDQYRDRALRVMYGIKTDPFAGKKLHGKLEGQYTVYVWPYRFVYKIYKEEKLIVIVDFDHRGRVYR